ncbi:hypothetical protein AK812_SmicGene29091 [Symbiodinium microadriaticum]|uniref:Uncharacterized protein n=1 Tax=Symbiodinium microadriaticum TaxID=2951 RepID=A0A1Q9D2Q1_SYMMI|nr:hypothetical protein AK812_SmicGene29091 [Symbiodinium microadriaticum]
MIGEDDYVHLYATRHSRQETWSCLYAPYKTGKCMLDQSEEYYFELPERRFCSERFDVSACATGDLCSLM